jgi:hypothetical protein
MRVAQNIYAFLFTVKKNGFYRLDAKGLNNGFDRHGNGN